MGASRRRPGSAPASSPSASSSWPQTRTASKSIAGWRPSTGCCGNDVEEIGPDEIKKLFPLARVDDIEAGFYLPQDGRVNPVDATMALAKGARLQGVKIIEGVSVTGVTTKTAAPPA